MPSPCPACGYENAERARFCAECGAELTSHCASCRAELPPRARFCSECGRPVGASPTPRSYTPKHLAEKILASKSALEGERKQVTVLFADVKGSMDLAEAIDPEEWHRILDRFFQILADGVHRFEGTVNQYTGDGIMALFGAPIAHEDHAQRACFAALQLRDGVRAWAHEVRVRHGIPFGVRIGLNSGEVVVGKIGDDLRMDYTAQGHVVGLAQRIEALAESGHIVLSEHTARLVEGYFELQDLGRIPLKGASAPVGLFDLAGVGRFRTRLDRSRSRGLSRFVGRDPDMAFLEAALARAQRGGQVVGVVADAGTGKSRLCAEFLELCRGRGVAVLEAHGVAHGKTIPMLPMLELWRGFYGITEADDPGTTRAKIAGRLLLLDESYRDALPILFDVLGVADPANPSPPLDPEQRQKRIHAVSRRILADPAYGGDTRITLLEDLHWFDGASDAFLETMVESFPATRNLLLLTFRPEYRARWMQRSYYQQLPLQPLGAEAISALLRDLLGSDPSVAALGEGLRERTRGNPFFIEEVVQSLVESHQLAGARGAYRLTVPLEALEVPASVQAVLAARIDRLPEREKQLLQTAAVIGPAFTEDLLRRVAADVSGIGEAEHAAALSALRAAEFLYEASLYPQLEYSFKHPLTQEVALRSQLRDRRTRVHAAVAQALEAEFGSLDERAAEIAQHWEEAEERGHAARWHARAAEWAGRSDPREGLRHWRRTRELARDLSDASERSALGLRACEQILALGWRMGGSRAEIAEVYEEGRALAEQRGDRRELALLVGRYSQVLINVGAAQDGIPYAEEAARLAQLCDAPALRAVAATFPAFAYATAGDVRAVVAWADRALAEVGANDALGREITGYSPRISMLHIRAVALANLGRLDEAEAELREVERAAEAARDYEVLSWLGVARASLAYLRGSREPVLECAHRSVEIAEQLDLDSSRIIALGGLGLAHLVEGRADEAREACRESAAIGRDRLLVVGMLVQVLAILAEAHLALGERDEAFARAREAIALALESDNRLFEVQSQLVLARVLLATDGGVPLAEIEAALDRAEALIGVIGARSFSPQLLELRGRLAAALGDPAGTARELGRALDVYREIGATCHADRLARELA